MSKSSSRAVLVISAWTALAALIVAGCQTAATPSGSTASTAPASTAPAGAAKSEIGGAELWSQSCSRCHNLRSPSSYGPAQWEVALYDMRVRANLTGDEQRKVLAFLKAASQ